jgi:hypothetical protein
MRMAIAWRNPRPVQTSHRYVKVTDIASGSVYVIQEMISGAQEDKWADLSTLEVQDGGSVSGTRWQTRASCALAAAAAKGNGQELTQTLVVSRVCSLFGLLLRLEECAILNGPAVFFSRTLLRQRLGGHGLATFGPSRPPRSHGCLGRMLIVEC